MASLRLRDGIFYIVWYDSAKGGNRERSLGRISQREARQRKAEFEVALRKADQGEPLRLPAAVAGEHYFAAVEPVMNPMTLKSKREAWNVFIDRLRPGALADVTQAEVRAFMDRYIQETGPRSGKPISRATANKWLREMKAIVNDMATVESPSGLPLHTGPNPFVGVKQFNIPSFRTRSATPEERDRMLAEAKALDPDLYIICLLGFWTGMRYAEIDNAEWTWFDWDQKTVTVASTAAWSTKKGKARTIPLRDDLIAALAPFRRESGYVITGARKKGNRPRKADVSGYRYNPRTIWATLLKKAGVEDFTLHNMRDTYATYYLKNGVDPSTVAVWMGHDDVKVLYKHYFDCIGYDARVNV